MGVLRSTFMRKCGRFFFTRSSFPSSILHGSHTHLLVSLNIRGIYLKYLGLKMKILTQPSISLYSYRLWNIYDICLLKKALTWAINWGLQTSPFWLRTIIKFHLLVKFLRALTFAVLEVSLIGLKMSFWPDFWFPQTFWFLSLKF